MTLPMTTEIVEFILNPDSPPLEVLHRAITHIEDSVAVILAGSRMECSKKIASFIIGKDSRGSSSLLGFNSTSCPSDAALVNGTSGHADDYDDTQLSSSPDRIYGLLTHPSIPVFSAALAIGEDLGCSGKQFIDAFITGVEVECKIAEAINPSHYMKGFHTTGTIGTFGACAAASKLLGLDEEELRSALGITASMGSGIRTNFGTMTKPLHAGRAASNGVVASILATEGFTADLNALDGRWGFMNVLGGKASPEKMKDRLGNPYTLIYPGVSVKLYPCGSLCQPSMDTLLEIIQEENLEDEEVKEIRLYAGPNILEPLRYKQPINELQAKFSLQFGLACILVKGRAGLREYTDAVVNSQEIRNAIRKVRTFHDPELSKMGTDKMRSIIEVELRDGRVFKRTADTARGTPQKPMKDTELDDKFRECASFVLDDKRVDLVLKMIHGFEKISCIKELTDLLV